MGGILTRAAVVVISVFAVNCFIIFVGNSKESDEKTVCIRLPKAYLVVGIIVALVFLGAVLWVSFFPNGTENICVYTGFFLFHVVGLFIIISCLNWSIRLEDEFFVYKNIWGRKQQVKYADITKIKVNDNSIIVQMGRKRFHIDPNAIGIEKFLSRCKQHIIERNNK